MTSPGTSPLENVDVLVFPCGSEIGLEIHAALSGSRIVNLHGASSVDDHGRYVYRNYIGGVPPVGSPDFVDAIAALATRLGIDLIYPAHDDVVLALAEHASALPCPVVTSPLATCRICRSKRATYAHVARDVAVPAVYSADDGDLPLPAFVKPDVGQGSRGAHLARTREEVAFHAGRTPGMLVLEYLPGEEYTVDCFTDARRELLFVGPRVRRRVSNGISVSTAPVASPGLEAMAKRLNAVLEFRGPWFFQAKEARGGELKLLEAAPRVAGSMGLQRARGVNLPLLGVYDALGVPVGILGNGVEIELDRALASRFRAKLAYEHVYVDLDDTLILRGHVSGLLVAFLYQCIDSGKRIHLLSSHAGDIDACLARFRLAGLFDTVTQIDKSCSKADYIACGPAIFIDDSYAERSRVAAKLGIPTFDLASFECLIDWRA